MYRPRRARGRLFGLGVTIGLLLAVPSVAHGLGLGSLKVNSALNEPLNAEIDLSSATKKELKSLNVGLAGRREFSDAGVDRAAFLSDIKFTVAKRLDGRPFLQLSSEQPIREPFLHFLVQVEWAGGRIVREFTALIDPPYMLAGRPPTVSAPASAPSSEPTPVPEAAPAPSSAPATAQALTEPEPAAAITEAAPPVVEPSPAPEPMMVAAPPPQPAEPLGPSTTGEVSISPDTGWPERTGTETAAAEAGATTVEGAGPAPVPSSAMFSPTGAPSWATMAQYEVQRGDTLWSIAERVRLDDSLTIEQVIMALYEANRHAFFRNNVNNVWAGKVLRIPDQEEAFALSRRDARSVFLAQYNEWQEYKLQLAGQERLKIAESSEVSTAAAASTSETPAPEMTPPAEEPKEQVEVAAKEPEQETQAAAQEVIEEQPKQESMATAEAATPAVRTAPPRDLLKIVRAAIDDADKGTLAEGESDRSQAERLALAERATTLDEALESKQMEQKELGERIDTVGSQLERQKRLMELENGTLAKTQEATGAGETKEAPKPQPTTPPTPAEQAEQTQKPTTTDTKVAESTPPPAAKTPEPEQPRARRRIRRDGARPAPRQAKPRRVVPPAPPEEKGVLAQIQEAVGDYVKEVGAAVVLIALGFIGLTYYRRRRQAAAEFEESILTDSDAITDSTTTDSGTPATTSAGSTSFLSDFSQGGMGNISTDEVDPLAETEVYLAYGRDEQAEEILKDAVAKDPTRHELKVKLLEIYSQRNDVPAFETLAEELYAAQQGQGGELWNRVAEMGSKLNPDNPMFQIAMPQPSAMSEPSYAIPAEVAAEPEMPPSLDFSAATEERTPEFDLAMGEDAVSPPSDAEVDSGLEFDLDMGTGMAEAASVADEPPIQDTAELSPEELGTAAFEQEDESVGLGETPADNVLDFDITEGGGADADTGIDQMQFEAGSDVAVEEALADATTGSEDAQQWDETATKLDLAKAYVDMGDAEGARSILDEVLAEGNEDQRKQAAELAAQIA